MSEEIWKDILGEEGRYQVSNFGRVRSLDRKTKHKDGKVTSHKGKILKLGSNPKGYVIAYLSYKVKTVHRLVMLAFNRIENAHQLQINHKDGDKTNNTLNNLEWVTNLENQRHAWKNGLKSALPGSRNPSSKLDENQVIKIKCLLLEGYSCRHIADIYGVNKSTIQRIRNNKAWRHVNV
jgi:hypothetical protein